MNHLLQNAWQPYLLTPVELTLQSLEENWERLHIGNSEIFPSISALEELVSENPIIAATLDHVPLDELSGMLIQGWLHFHQGNYQKATQLALASGLPGLNLASKAMAIYATHL